MAFEDINKERLAFVSGNVLVCGLLSLKLWSVVSSFQTGMHITFFTDSDPGGDVIGTEYWIFSFMTKLLTFLAVIALLAIVYLLLQGILLAIAIEKKDKSKPSIKSKSRNNVESFLRKLSEKIYSAILLSGVYPLAAIFLLPIAIGTVTLEGFLATHLPLSITMIGWILRLFLLILFMILIIYIGGKVAKKKWWKDIRQSVGQGLKSSLPVIITIAALLFVANPIIEYVSYTMSLSLKESIVDPAQTKFIEAHITLGGATSDAREATLQLLDSNGNVKEEKLPMDDLGNGQYVSLYDSSKLSRGRYQFALQYPHISLTSSYPFIIKENRKSEYFIIISNP